MHTLKTMIDAAEQRHVEIEERLANTAWPSSESRFNGYTQPSEEKLTARAAFRGLASRCPSCNGRGFRETPAGGGSATTRTFCDVCNGTGQTLSEAGTLLLSWIKHSLLGELQPGADAASLAEHNRRAEAAIEAQRKVADQQAARRKQLFEIERQAEDARRKLQGKPPTGPDWRPPTGNEAALSAGYAALRK